MKKVLFFVPFLLAVALFAETRDQLVDYLPRNSHLVGGADFAQMQDNEVYQSMERNGQIWSYDDKNGIVEYIKLLKLDTKKDIRAFAFSKYVNNYGGSGEVRVFLLSRDWSSDLEAFTATPYAGKSLYRISPEQDKYATLLTPNTIAAGNLNEVKMAVDVASGKVPALKANPNLAPLYAKIPVGSTVWAIAMPLSRRKAADANAKQSTNAIIGGFQTYYFYGIPTKTATRAQFYGQTQDEKQAAFMSSFMIGTLLVTKFRVEQPLAEMLDKIDVKHNGNTVQVSMLVTKEMVDAYFKGKLGF
ncbi:hypothetical protein L0222_06230 [bacterium]|nr:hypothetical protein [bacterium]MCI0604146.1 hypothetical protein [bacterium]